MKKLKLQLEILKDMEIKPNYAELSRKYNKDWRTIKKYNEGYEGKPKIRNKLSKLDEFKEEIKVKMSYEGVNVSSVYQFFVDKYGEKVKGYNNFLNYVKKNNFIRIKKDSSPRFETYYGVQSQVDWKESLSLVSRNGELFEFNVFAMILSASRKVYYEYSITRTREDVFRCIINALNNFGGVTDEVLFDNMSSIVDIQTNKTNEKVIQFAKDFGFKVRRCKPRRAQTKGKVESTNRFIKWLIPYNNEFEDENELKLIIQKIMLKVNTRKNDTTGVPPNLLFQQEKEHLNNLPNTNIITKYLPCEKKYKVDNNGLILYKDQRYSVPSNYIGTYVSVKIEDDNLYVYCNTDLISIHKITNKLITYNKNDYVTLFDKRALEAAKINEIAEKNLQIFDHFIKKECKN